MNRTEALQSLIHLRASVAEAKTALAAFPWDSEEKLVTLKREHLVNVLTQFRQSALTAADVEDWANGLEVREDVDYNREDTVGVVLHELANPLLTEPLTPQRADALLKQLHGG